MYPSLTWEGRETENSVYLTFDDGPHPLITPWVLNQLDRFDFKATFFCIGDNIRKYPEIYKQILDRGHQTGNHTFNHLSGFKTSNDKYFENIAKCAELVKNKLFRPPYGHIKSSQILHLKPNYQIVMWSLLVEDWNPKLDRLCKLDLLKKLTRKGDIIVFHDSEKAKGNLEYLLPLYLEFLKTEHYKTALLLENE